MAGKPLTKLMVAELQRRAKLKGDNATPLDVVYDFLADGNTQRALANDLSQAIGRPVSGGVLSTWIHSTAEGKAMLARAKQACATALVEQALEILDDADESREAIAKAKAQADQRTWMAARMDRGAWGDAAPQVNVQVNMGQLHLDALRARAIEVKTIGQLSAGEADVEVVPE